MIVQSKAPVRIDLAGGWTDVSIFAASAGGAVVNATINKYVHGRMYVLDTEDPVKRRVSGPSGKYVVESGAGEGIEVAYRSDLPAGSGLGTSATLNVVWLSLIKSKVQSDEDRRTLAELSYDLERILGILGGKQDQYASAFGGFNFFTFGETVGVERLKIRQTVTGEPPGPLLHREVAPLQRHPWGWGTIVPEPRHGQRALQPAQCHPDAHRAAEECRSSVTCRIRTGGIRSRCTPR